MSENSLREALAGLRERELAKWLHLKLSAAQNLPYEDGDTCPECVEAVEKELLPIFREALHKKFGYVAGPEGKCVCAYCVGDLEALMDHSAELEIENLHLEKQREREDTMKTLLRSILLLLAALPAAAKTYPTVTLDSTGTFTFDITRIPTSLTLTVQKGGGYITIASNAGESAKYYVGPGTPYTANFVSPYPKIPSKFTKLAGSLTFTAPAGTLFTVTNLVVKDREATSFVPVLQGVLTKIDGNTVTIKADGAQQTGPNQIPVACYDKDGYIATVNMNMPVF
ncbi:MAG: hypothetical protein M3O09_19420 [Acidobacteriota bacterium]|nr:hypothetical protein [Acidobacteriota bacterium]